MNSKTKKIIITHIPYAVIALFATKIGLAWRLTQGADVSARLLALPNAAAVAFQDAIPSLHPADMFVGIALGALLRLAVYVRSKNQKKYRKGVEYGSARWEA